MFQREQRLLIFVVWATLAVALLVSLLLGRWSMAFVSIATLVASATPLALARRFHIYVPLPFLTSIVLFIFAALFLGEALDFYERYWWWDIALHAASAVGFGMVGFVFVFYLFEGDRYAAPAWAIAFIGFCVATSVGAAWEIFEFAMDQIFGLNMQKSGLLDTMWDLIVDGVGGFVGAFSGFVYLKGRELGGPPALIADFVRRNREFFRKAGRTRRR